jgi:VanZ family protein
MLAVAGLAVVLVATLAPSSTPGSRWLHRCLLCGEFGLADAIANVLLFLPVAAGVSCAGWSSRRTIVLGFLLSAAIEYTQLRVVPGRDAAVGDIIWNTVGTGLGAGIARGLPVRRRSGLRACFAAAVALAVIAFAGSALRPSFPPEVYYGQWTPDLRVFEWYRGRVLSADIGGLPLPSDRLTESATVRDRLTRGTTVRVLAVAGPRTKRLAPLFSIADGILLVGPDGDDLVLRVRRRAIEFRLSQPDLRWRGAMAGIASGDTLKLEVRRNERGYCLRLGDRERCGLAYTAGQSWGLVRFIPQMPAAARAILSSVFMAILGLPIGLMFRRGVAGYAAVAIAVAGALVVPTLVGLAPTPPVQLAALLVGGVAGALAP